MKKNSYKDLAKFFENSSDMSFLRKQESSVCGNKSCEVQLVDFSQNSDDKILTALIYKISKIGYADAQDLVKNMTQIQKQDFLKESLKDIKLYNTVLREFEFADFTYDLQISGACFGQLKRHRLATIISQNYDTDLEVKIPEAIIKIGYEKKIFGSCEKNE